MRCAALRGHDAIQRMPNVRARLIAPKRFLTLSLLYTLWRCHLSVPTETKIASAISLLLRPDSRRLRIEISRGVRCSLMAEVWSIGLSGLRSCRSQPNNLTRWMRHESPRHSLIGYRMNLCVINITGWDPILPTHLYYQINRDKVSEWSCGI